MILTKSWTWI